MNRLPNGDLKLAGTDYPESIFQSLDQKGAGYGPGLRASPSSMEDFYRRGSRSSMKGGGIGIQTWASAVFGIFLGGVNDKCLESDGLVPLAFLQESAELHQGIGSLEGESRIAHLLRFKACFIFK